MKCAATALGLYRMYVDAHDDDLSEFGVTRDDVLSLARGFDEDETGRASSLVAVQAHAMGKVDANQVPLPPRQ